MKTTIVILCVSLAGCAAWPMGNASCEKKAEAFANQMTHAKFSIYYMMDWRGKYEDAYKRCVNAT